MFPNNCLINKIRQIKCMHTPYHTYMHRVFSSSLVLTAEEQGSIRELTAASQRSAAERDLPEKQPFVIPENCFDRDISDIPKSCSFRYC